jgi:hypothetical protein
MRLFILLFGAVAALLGFAGSIAALALQLREISAGTRDGIDGYIFAAAALSAIGLYGAWLALRHPRLSCTVMAAAAVGGLLSIAWFYLISAVIFSIASGLGFLWRNEGGLRLRGS